MSIVPARAARHHEIMSEIENMISKPKPTKKPKVKRVKVQQRRKLLCKQIEAIVKLIIFWRDGQVCVQHMDNNCGNGLMWGHYVAQGQSAWLRYDLGNVFVQCGNHNLRDHNGDKSYAYWFVKTFGIKAAEHIELQKTKHAGGKQRTVQELEEMLAYYDELYQNRYYVDADLKSLVTAGYFGEHIQTAWALEIK